MSRVKRGILTKKRHKKVLKLAKGYYGARGRLFKSAQETVEKGLVYAYRDRKVKKREFRGQWIVRISAACKENGISYSRFMNALKKKGMDLNRKILADIALQDPEGFSGIIASIKK